jgi:hemerythrin superfamily protein
VYVESTNSNPLITIRNSNDVKFDNLRYGADTKLLFSIGGKRTGNIQVLHSDLLKAAKKTEFKAGVDSKVLTVSN